MTQPSARHITEALRACARHVAGPQGGGDDSWAQLDRRLALLAEDLAIAIDDRPNVCHQCGVPCPAPPLAEMAALLRPDAPTAAVSTDAAQARRLARVLWVLGSLLGQCEQHGIPIEVITNKRRPRV
jgi:hypothetical protein